MTFLQIHLWDPRTLCGRWGPLHDPRWRADWGVEPPATTC